MRPHKVNVIWEDGRSSSVVMRLAGWPSNTIPKTASSGRWTSAGGHGQGGSKHPRRPTVVTTPEAEMDPSKLTWERLLVLAILLGVLIVATGLLLLWARHRQGSRETTPSIVRSWIAL